MKLWDRLEQLRVEIFVILISFSLAIMDGILQLPFLTMIPVIIIPIYFLIRFIRSFRYWKESKRAALTYFFINLMIFCTVMGIIYLLAHLPGGAQLLLVSIVLAENIIIFGMILFLIKRENRIVFWNISRPTVFRGAVYLVICLVSFYMIFDLDQELRESGVNSFGWIPLY